MRIHSCLYAFVAFLCVAVAQAQSAGALDAFRTQMANKTLVLRNFSDDASVDFTWDGTEINYKAPALSGFEVVKVTGVKQKDRTVTLSADRFFVIRDIHTQGLTITNANSPAKIVVQLPAPDTRLLGLTEALFFKSLQDALGEAHTRMGDLIPNWDPGTKKYVSCVQCKPLYGTKAEPSAPTSDDKARMEPPKLLKKIDPEFPSGAPVVGGEILVGLTVTDKGIPDSLWILESMGAAYDQEAARVVSRYRFEPATKDGLPVPVRLNVAVHFQVASS